MNINQQKSHKQTCSQIQEDLSAYLDGELEDALMLDISHHLKDCDDCRQELEGLKILSNAFQQVAELPLPAGFAAELYQKLIATQGAEAAPAVEGPIPLKLWQRSWFPRAVAACIVLGVGLSIGTILKQDQLTGPLGNVMVASEGAPGLKAAEPKDMPAAALKPLDGQIQNDSAPNAASATSTPTAYQVAKNEPANKELGADQNSPTPKAASTYSTEPQGVAFNTNGADAATTETLSNLEAILATEGKASYVKILDSQPLTAKNQVLTLASYFEGTIVSNEDSQEGHLSTQQNPYLRVQLSQENFSKLLGKMQGELQVTKVVLAETPTSAKEDTQGQELVQVVVEFVK